MMTKLQAATHARRAAFNAVEDPATDGLLLQILPIAALPDLSTEEKLAAEAKHVFLFDLAALHSFAAADLFDDLVDSDRLTVPDHLKGKPFANMPGNFKTCLNLYCAAASSLTAEVQA